MWIDGQGGPRVVGELNPRGWKQIDFNASFDSESDRATFQRDERPLLTKLSERHDARLWRRREVDATSEGLPPLSNPWPIQDLPRRIHKRVARFSAVVAELEQSNLQGTAWYDAFAARLRNVNNEGEDQGAGKEDDEEWEGRLIWGAALRDDYRAWAAPWAQVGQKLAKVLPEAVYPSAPHAGKRAPFIDVGIASSIGFTWALSLDWDTHLTFGLVTALAYWTDMASDDDAPAGRLCDIFDGLPALTQACSTGRVDAMSPMIALAMDYMRTHTVLPVPGPSPPSLESVWLSRTADVGAREATCITGCTAPWSPHSSADEKRMAAAWHMVHDLYDLPRDLMSGNRVNGILYAMFCGYSVAEVLQWIRDSVAIAVGRRATTCTAKVLLCTAFVHVTNPRWSINGIGALRAADWPAAPARTAPRPREPLPLPGDDETTAAQSSPCNCTATDVSRRLAEAAREALSGAVPGFATTADRLRAHNTGMTAIMESDWDTIVELSRTSWATCFDDCANIAAWADGVANAPKVAEATCQDTTAVNGSDCPAPGIQVN